jgi:hypothetical protein
VSDEETFTRLLYFGTVQLHFTIDDVWLMPVGQLLDLIACHRQFLGYDTPERIVEFDAIIPV